jgi:LysR family glycine cleavage system transcriptional activator
MERRLLPPLSSIRGFEAAARKLSHRAAAKELNLTHPAISHQIKNLEAHLGIKLFNKDGRNVILSDEGKLFYPYVLEALDQLELGVSVMRRASKNSSLRVQTYVTFSIRWLARRLPEFYNAHPGINVQLATYASKWEFDEESSDIGIIYCDTLPSEKFHWRQLFDSRVYPVCSPKLLEQYNKELQPSELLDLPLFAVETEFDYWTRWFISANVDVRNIIPHMVVDTKAVALEMAINNEGVALVNGPFVDDDLRLGRLVKPCKHETTFPGGWGIICRKENADRPDIKCFFDWMLKAASDM